jgi:integrase
LQDAVSEDELLTENVAKKLRIDHRYRPKFKAWTPDEASQFLKAIRPDRLYALFAVALSLGLRRGEALGLRWQDLDLVNGVVRIEHALHTGSTAGSSSGRSRPMVQAVRCQCLDHCSGSSRPTR